MKKLLTILCLFVSLTVSAQIYTVPNRGQAGVIQLKTNRGLPNSITAGTTPTEQAASKTFDALGTGGTYTANSLDPTNFDNGAGTSSLSGGLRYIINNTEQEYTLKGKTETRDQEVTQNVTKGSIFLRVNAAGKGLCLTIDPAAHRLAIGIITNCNSAGSLIWEASGRSVIYDSDVDDGGDASNLIPGFNSADALDNITFGVYGYDIYVKFNGTEYFRVKSRYHCVKGKAGVKVHSGGINTFEINHFIRQTLYSNTDNQIVDARDFGMKQGNTTGSITGGTNTLTVASLNGLVAGDRIIVEIGGEATFNGRAGGMRGTKGVGGTFPNLSYANAAAMNADNSKPTDTRAWLEDTGVMYYYTGSVWDPISVSNMVGAYASETKYYNAKALPKALRPYIVSIAGNVLTLDRNATVSTTSANVYFDNNYILSKLCVKADADYFLDDYPDLIERDMSAAEVAGGTVLIPAGSYAVGEQMYFTRAGITVTGAGVASTELFSPDGVASFNILAIGFNSGVVEDFKCRGNVGLNGYGSHWDISYGGGYETAQITQLQDIEYPEGFQFRSTTGGIARNMEFEDIFTVACGSSSSSSGCYRYRIRVVMTEPTQAYLGWYFQDANSPNGIFEECDFDSDYLNKAYECFNTTNTQFINCDSRNGLWALNNAEDFIMTGCTQTITGMSKPNAVDVHEACVNINHNFGASNYGGTITNHVIVIEDYVDDRNDCLYGITTNSSNGGITITGGSYTAPDWLTPADIGPQGIKSDGFNVTVNGFTVVGSQVSGRSFNKSNISVFDGSVLNCVAEYFHVYTAVTYTNNTGTKVIVDP